MGKKIILITGASSGFGRLTVEALAKAGHTVYAPMRNVASRNAQNAAEMVETSKRDGVDLRPIELDVQSEPSVDAAISKIIAGSGKIDVLVHNAGHMMFGRPRPSRRSNSPSSMMSTCLAHSASTAPYCPTCARPSRACCCGYRAAAQPGARRPILLPILPPRLPWIRWRCSTRAS